MADIVTLKAPDREDWLHQLSDVITEPEELLQMLALNSHSELIAGGSARKLFALRVPRVFAAKMKKGDPLDPLLLQVLTKQQEFSETAGYLSDPLDEQGSEVPGLLHKYKNRALLIVKGGCAVNCRYCFRRHFPYHKNQGNKRNWQAAIDYLQQHRAIDEVILSGGDPLMAKDSELDWLISALERIGHLKRLRIHSRLPVVIPSRITEELCQRLSQSHLQTVLVTHINHAREIDKTLRLRMTMLKRAGVILLNQSVLLRGINDNALTLAALSNALFDAGILPYYLHQLDKVQGAAHFSVGDNKARAIVRELTSLVSGYMVPRLVREIAGEPAKTLLDLQLRQQ